MKAWFQRFQTLAIITLLIQECGRHRIHDKIPLRLKLEKSPQPVSCSIKEGDMQKYGIDKTLEVFEDLTHLLVSGAKLYTRGVGLHTFSEMWGILDSIKELILDLPPAVPELMDLDSQECSKLGAAAHKMLSEVAQAFK